MNKLFAVLALAHLGALNPQLSTVFAQGGLIPPGAPAPTMKTLDQIYAKLDGRIPITNTTSAVTITQPGSYYLTASLTVSSGNAITLAANGVMLDLNGYAIRSSSASATGSAILINSGLRNLTIKNGFIESGVTNNGSGVYSGSGFGNGIFYSGVQPQNIRVSGVSVSGCLSNGIYLFVLNSSVVESCIVRSVGNTGNIGILASTIKDSVAVDCGGYAIYGDQVTDCRGESTGNGTGIYAATAQNCYGSSSSGYGVFANLNASNCHGSTVNGTAGLFALNASFCTGTSQPGGRAIQATIATGCLISTAGTNLINYKYNMP